MSARPPTLISGFGSVSVIGRIRIPSPAANTMAVLGTGGLIGGSSVKKASGIGFDGRLAERPRQVVLIPERKRPKQRMGEIAGQVALDPRQVAQVLGLAVPLVEAGEDAEDLGRPLGARRRISCSEALGVECGVGRGPAPHVK